MLEVVTTRLAPDRYLELIEADAARLLDQAQDLDAEVPTCPGWTVDDLVGHLAMVYQHKIESTRLQQQPAGWPPPRPAGDVREWLARSTAELLELLRERGPDAPSATWHPPDQTVGFWYRRMAHETSVHRVDAESVTGELRPVASDLAVDGIDEVLMLMLEGDWSDLPDEEWGEASPDLGDGQTIAVLGGDAVWRVSFDRHRVDVSTGAGPADATVGGQPSEVLLWLWGRRPFDAVEVSGDESAVRALRARLVLATG